MRQRSHRRPAGVSFTLDIPQEALPALSTESYEDNALFVHALQSPLLELGQSACAPSPDGGDSTLFVLFHNKPLFSASLEGLYSDSRGSVGGLRAPCSTDSLSDADQSNANMPKVDTLETLCFDCDRVDLDSLRVVEDTSRRMGQQGTVEVVEDSLKRRFARKIIDVSSLTSSTARSQLSAVELQGRKAGIVRELTTARSLCQKPPCRYVVETLNATCNLEGSQEIHIVMELMSRSLLDVQNTVAKLNRTYDTLASVLPRRFQKRLTEHDSLRQAPVPEEIIQVVAHDVLQGLRHLHTEHMVVHGDLKPANILLSVDFSCFKIGDFGCAMKLSSDSRCVSQTVDLGSRAYKAPEQLQDMLDEQLEYNEKVDIWALGLLLLELAYGCHPTKLFQGNFWDYRSLLLQPESWIRPTQGSPDFVAFVRKCLTVDPRERPCAADLLGDKFVSSVTPPEQRDQVKKYVQFIDGNVSEQMRIIENLLNGLESPVSATSPTFLGMERAAQAMPLQTAKRPKPRPQVAVPLSKYATPARPVRHHQGVGK